MSAGPIKREREATVPPKIPRPPKRDDVVRLSPAPYSCRRDVLGDHPQLEAVPPPTSCCSPHKTPTAPSGTSAAASTNSKGPHHDRTRPSYPSRPGRGLYALEEDRLRAVVSGLQAALRARDAQITEALALHTMKSAFHHPDLDEESSWVNSLDDVRAQLAKQESLLDDDERIPWEQELPLVTRKDFCGHCQSMVVEANDPWEAPFAPAATWPCPTVAILSRGSQGAAEPSAEGVDYDVVPDPSDPSGMTPMQVPAEPRAFKESPENLNEGGAGSSSVDRTIEDFHATRESGTGCPAASGGPHYFAFIDPNSDGRICIDCGTPEGASRG